jgi:hypothetical protein
VASTGITSTPRTSFTFPTNGRIIGVKGMVREGMNLLSHVTLSVADQDGRFFFTNGQAEAFVSFAILTGNAYDQGGFFPMFFRDVNANEQWSFMCSSGDAIPGSGSTTYTPEVELLMESDTASLQ